MTGFDSFPPSLPPVYLITHYQRSLAAWGAGDVRRGLALSWLVSRTGPAVVADVSYGEPEVLGQKLKNPHGRISACGGSTPAPRSLQGGGQSLNTLLPSALTAVAGKEPETQLSEIHSQSALCARWLLDSAREPQHR